MNLLPWYKFLNFESRNFINKIIERVDIDEQNTIHEQFEILRRVKSFYHTLYLEKDAKLTAVDIDNITHSSYGEKYPVIWRRTLSKVLKNMKHNKSHGSDGFTAEFFVKIGHNYMYTKYEQPRQFHQNWRPVTLINVLYKLILGCLFQRSKSYLNFWYTIWLY